MLLRTVAGVAVATLLAIGSAPAAPAPTPTPGGANQVEAVAGKVGDTLFNGVIRLQVSELRDAVAADQPQSILPNADQRVMVMSVLVRNGLHRNFIDLIRYTLADKDDVTFVIPDYRITPNPLNVAQGAAARQRAMFPVDKGFVPVKLLVQCATCGSTRFAAFRVALPPPATASP